MNQEQICRFICQELPKHHLQRLLEAIEAAFSRSNQHLKESYRNVPLAGPGPQSHHFMVQEALLDLTRDEGFEVVSRATRPAGGHFALVQAGAIKVTTSVVTTDRTPLVREAKFRRNLRQENERLRQQHPDLFEPRVPPFGPSEKSLHALLIPYAAKWLRHNDHSRPLSCIIAVPYSDHNSRFHLWKDVNELWQYYEVQEDGFLDIAYPKLRDSMRDAENRDRNVGDVG